MRFHILEILSYMVYPLVNIKNTTSAKDKETDSPEVIFKMGYYYNDALIKPYASDSSVIHTIRDKYF